MFVPRFEQNENNYKLCLGPTNLYLFFLYFYSVYERVLRARELVEEKINKDFKDDHSCMNWSRKFSDVKMRKDLGDERFQYFIKSVYTTMYFSNQLDINKYEDLARELLGNEAYLLFQMDKVVNNCAKHLAQFYHDRSYTIAKNLFEAFEEMDVKNEEWYLANFNAAAA